MTKLLDEIRYDIAFVKSHSLQPKWYKALKVFILLGFLVGHCCLFGPVSTVLFFAIFLSLSALVHLIYRAKTRKFKQSWLDFVVVQEGDVVTAKSIGPYYYWAIVSNAILSLAVSHALT